MREAVKKKGGGVIRVKTAILLIVVALLEKEVSIRNYLTQFIISDFKKNTNNLTSCF